MRIVAVDSGKEIKAYGPEKIQYLRQTKEFVANLEGMEFDKGQY